MSYENYNLYQEVCQDCSLSEIIKTMRICRIETQAEFAEELNTCRSLIQKYEYGTVQPKPNRMKQILQLVFEPKAVNKIYPDIVLKFYVGKK